MKAIVTGANGFVGSSLIKKLLDSGVEILAIDISFENNHLPNNKNLKKLELSVEKIDSLKESINYGDYDLFYHFAWIGVNGQNKGKIECQLRNIEMTLLCAKAAYELGCKKFLCAGTVAERNVLSLKNVEKTGPGMFYGSAKYATHLLLETYCKSVGLSFVWMQFSNIFGPNNKTGNLINYTIDKLLNNEEASFGPANQPYDFIFVDDLIEAIFRLGTNTTSKNFYFVGSGKPKVLREYLVYIGNYLRKPDLVKIGYREDDGIKYSYEMFNIQDLLDDIGDFRSYDFKKGIEKTVEGYQND